MSAPNVYTQRVAYRQGAYPGIRIIHNASLDSRVKRWITFKGLICWCNPITWAYCCKTDRLFNDSYVWIMENRIEWNTPQYCCWCFDDNVKVVYFDQPHSRAAIPLNCCENCCNTCGESLEISDGSCIPCCRRRHIIRGIEDAASISELITKRRKECIERSAPSVVNTLLHSPSH